MLAIDRPEPIAVDLCGETNAYVVVSAATDIWNGLLAIERLEATAADLYLNA
jgi:hypothetical protein